MHNKSIPNVEVGILKKNKIKFKLSGQFKISENNKYYSDTYEVSVHNKAIVLKTQNNTQTFNNEILFTPCKPTIEYFELFDVVIGVDFHWEQYKNQKFQGDLKLLIVDGEIQVINIISIENYLLSVISSEMNATSSINLLKAHTIISRSWLIAQINNNNSTKYTTSQKSYDEFIQWYDKDDHKNYDVCADDHCQRYQGISNAQNTAVVKAVNHTKGQVLMFDGEICDARYSKCCGGISEQFENCWEPVYHPYLQKVIDRPANDNSIVKDMKIEKNAQEFITNSPEAFCNTNNESILKQVLNDFDYTTKDFYRWEVNYTQNELANLIHQKSNIDFGQIINLEPLERGESGRIIKLKIIGTKKTLTIGKELEIRRWLSKSHLYSSAFVVEYQDIKKNIPEKFVLKGAGWGHGVGLCQIGAAVMGEQGYSDKEILKHYFKGSEIVKYY